MQSHPIKFKCGHVVSLPLDERGNDLKAKIASLEQLDCPKCAALGIKINAAFNATRKPHER